MALWIFAGTGCGPAKPGPQPTGKPATSSDAALPIPPPPPAPDTRPPLQQFAEMRAQVDSIPLEADPQTLSQAAGMARAIGDIWRAEELLRAARRKDPKSLDILARLADTLERATLHDEARALYDALRRAAPEDVRGYLGLASIAVTRRNGTEAWRWLEQGAEKCADDAAELTHIARRYQDWDDLASADRTLRRAQAAAPDDSALTIERAALLIRAGKQEEARTVLRSLTAKEPDNAAAWQLLARSWSSARIEKNDVDAARVAAEKSLELVPGDPEGRRIAALIFRATGQPRRAAQELAAAVSANPMQVDARYTLARLYGELGKPEWEKEQLAICDRLRAAQRESTLASSQAVENPLNPKLRVAAGKALEKVGDYAGAIRMYQIAVRIAPNDSSARAALASVYDRLAWGDPPKGPAR